LSSPHLPPIPTLSEWAQLGMVALLLTGGLPALTIAQLYKSRAWDPLPLPVKGSQDHPLYLYDRLQ